MACWYVHKWSVVDQTEWDCYATSKKLPNESRGMNMTAAFNSALYVEYILCWIALFCQIFHLLSKFIKLDGFKITVGWIEMAFYLLAFAWLIWATIIRFRQEGIVCAGATNNVSSPTRPYAWSQGRGLLLSCMLGWGIPSLYCITTSLGCL